MFTRTPSPLADPSPRRASTADDLIATGLTLSYPGAHDRPALNGVDVTITAGESTAIMGPSGSGKSTLLHVLAGILAPTSGTVLWQGRELGRLSDAARTRMRRSDFGFVFQAGHLLPELPAVENIALPLMLGGTSRSDATRRAEALLSLLDLAGFGSRRPGELSGGQAQRVAIARALVGAPGIVFADEPTGALDQDTGAEVMGHLVRRCAEAGTSLVVVTHDEQVAACCERTIRLRDGRVLSDERAAGGPARAEGIR